MFFNKYKYLKVIFYVTFVFQLIPVMSFAVDPTKDLTKYLQRKWTIENGLPQNTITTLIQTYDGYIWIGTPSGLARFDGVKFKIYNRINTPKLKNDNILSLYEDQNQVLWIGTGGGGLCSYEKGKWSNYTTENGLSNNYVRTIVGDWQGNYWIGTNYGLTQIGFDDIQIYTTKDGLYDNIITALTYDNWGNLWIGTLQGGLAKLKDGIITVYDSKNNLQSNSIKSLFADKFNTIWIGTLEGLYSLNSDDQFVQYISGTSYTPFTSIVKDQFGYLWCGTMADGLRRMKDDSVAGLASEDGFPDDYIRTVLIDRDETIWLGTDAAGLFQLKDRSVEIIAKENGLPENAVYAVLKDSNGNFWCGSRNNGVCRIVENSIVQVINKDSGLSSNQIKVLFEDKKGQFWFGTENSGINIYHDGKITLLNTSHGLSSNHITSIFQDSSENIWIGTDKGLNRLRNNSILVFNLKSGLSNPFIRVIFEKQNGTILVGTKSGLFQLSDETFVKINPQNQNSNFDVMSLYEDEENILWIGTNGNGLKRWNNEKFTTFTTENGLHDNYIFSITEDDFENLWMSSYNGVFKISRNLLNDFVSKENSFITSIFFDEADGMKSRQCIGECYPTFWKDNSGKLFYPTVNGISIFDPNKITKDDKSPEVLLEDFLVDDKSELNREDLLFTNQSNQFEILFTAIDFTSPEKIRFRYKLDGYDSEFMYTTPGENRLASYVNLSDGKFEFLVQTANRNGIWSESSSILAFEIKYPFYQKPLFIILSLSFLLSIGGTIFYKIQKKKPIQKIEKYKTSTLDPGRAEQIIPKLLYLLEEDKVFLDPDLLLKDLAKKLKIQNNHLSQIINERFNSSFNDFINKYRIEEAKKLLSNIEEKKRTVLDIMYDCGFNSKSVFNTAFKKLTGQTPSEFRKKFS